MRTVKAITGLSAAEKFYKKLGGAVRYILPAATVLAFMGLSNEVVAQTPSTDITLTNLTINENEAIGTAVGFLSTDDIDLENHAYTLVAGIGDDDNASFSIIANKLQTAEVFNHEVRASYNVRIATTGDDGLTFEKPFVISIGNVNDKPVLSAPSRTVQQNTTLNLDASDFTLNFADEDGHGISQIEILSLPDYGVLRLDAVPLMIGDFVSVSDLGNLYYDAPDTVTGQTSFDWNAEDGAEFADAASAFFIKVTRPRISGTSAADVTVVNIPSGQVLIGHPGTRPTASDSLPGIPSIGGIPGRRPGIGTADPSFAKFGAEEVGIEAYENLDLNIAAYPNPFASTAQIKFTLPEAANVEVNVYNYMGAMVKQVTNELHPAGENMVALGSELSNGTYIYTVKVTTTDGQTAIFKSGSIVKMK